MHFRTYALRAFNKPFKTTSKQFRTELSTPETQYKPVNVELIHYSRPRPLELTTHDVMMLHITWQYLTFDRLQWFDL